MRILIVVTLALFMGLPTRAKAEYMTLVDLRDKSVEKQDLDKGRQLLLPSTDWKCETLIKLTPTGYKQLVISCSYGKKSFSSNAICSSKSVGTAVTIDDIYFIVLDCGDR